MKFENHEQYSFSKFLENKVRCQSNYLIKHLAIFKVALSVCFALKSSKEYLLLFPYILTLGKDVTFPIITTFKTNNYLSYLSVNRIPN